MIKCLFFDRDGVINKRIIGSYVTKQEEFELNDDILKLIEFCDKNNILKIIITNQQGIEKKIMTENDLSNVHKYMNQLLIQKSLKPFNDIYYATELASDNPIKRKPSPKMILDAITKYNLNPDDCIMIGDSKSDIEAANNASIKSIFYSQDNYQLADISTNNILNIIKYLKSI